MTNWRYKIELNNVLNKANDDYDLSRVEEPVPQDVIGSIAKELEKAPPLASFSAEVKKCKTIAALNRVLENVWNEADSSLVWCGE